MNELGTTSALLLDILVIVVTMSALAWRESRWSHASRTATTPSPVAARRHRGAHRS
jgi:hypothetical protein